MRMHGMGFQGLGVGGAATAIGVGPSGQAWVVGTNIVSSYGKGIYRWQNGAWSSVAGAATKIAVSPEGTPWVLDAFGDIYKWNGSAFVGLPAGGCATSIGVGPNDEAWIIGCGNVNKYGNGIFRWQNGGWSSVPGAAAQVAVSPEGTPWVLDALGNVYTWNGSAFVGLPVGGCGTSIGVGPNGEAWMIGCSTTNNVFHWQQSQWANVPGSAALVAVSPEGTPWVVNASQSIFEYE
jgi:hypothetical protein